MAGANWRQPTGPGSSIAGKDNHPVVHIAHEDALAYARWRGRSLPTEAQWEFAARGGRDGEDDWSSAFDADGKPIANTWQGIFPVLNTKDDGYAGTAPVGCFKPNGYGLYDMIGNVWEWTGDWYRPGHSREAAVNPTGPDFASIRVAAGQAASRVIKGGSHLCAANYCSRYRPAARQPQEVNLSAAHLGFRTVLNKPPATSPWARNEPKGTSLIGFQVITEENAMNRYISAVSYVYAALAGVLLFPVGTASAQEHLIARSCRSRSPNGRPTANLTRATPRRRRGSRSRRRRERPMS